MIAAVLGILHAIGILLLVLLLLILLLLAVVLLIPFRYRFDGVTFPKTGESGGQSRLAKDEESDGQSRLAKDGESKNQVFFAEGRVSWLFRLAEIHCKYEDGLSITGRFAFFRFFHMDTTQDEDEDADDAQTLKTDETKTSKPASEAAQGMPRTPKETDADRIDESGKQLTQSEEEEILSALKRDMKNDAEHAESNVFTKLRERLRSIRHRDENRPKAERIVEIDFFHILEKADAIRSKWEEGWDGFVQSAEEWEERLERYRHRIRRIQSRIEDARNRNAVRILGGFVRNVLKHICPNKIWGKVLLGFEDPANTGFALALLGTVRSAFIPEIVVESDFEREIIDAEIHAKGRIRLGNILWYIMMVVIRRDVWRLYKSIKKIREDWKNGR